MRGVPKDPQLKAAVVSALLAGQGVCEIAAEYKISKQLVSQWKQRLVPIVLDGTIDEYDLRDRRSAPSDAGPRPPAEPNRDIGEMIGEMLRANLVTLRVIAEHGRNPKWLASQRASEIGVFYGILADKSIRLLEAAERAAEAGAIDTAV